MRPPIELLASSTQTTWNARSDSGMAAATLWFIQDAHHTHRLDAHTPQANHVKVITNKGDNSTRRCYNFFFFNETRVKLPLIAYTHFFWIKEFFGLYGLAYTAFNYYISSFNRWIIRGVKKQN